MAYVLVYSQNFAAGNSLHTQTEFYARNGELTPSASGPDPLYPEARFGDSVEVINATGLSGQKALDCQTGHHGPEQGYASVGVHYNLPTYDAALAGGFTIPRGAIEAKYRPNATSLSENTYCHLVNIFDGINENSTGGLDLDIHTSGGSWWLRLRTLQSFGETDQDLIHEMGSSAALQDIWHTYRLEWNDGSLECEPEAYVRVLVDGSVVYQLTETADFLELHSTVKTIRSTTLGFAGLFGEVTDLRLYDNPCDGGGSPPPEPGPIPDDVGKVCPCKTGEGDGTGTPPSVLPVLQPWSPECIGGGVVPLAAAPSAAELW